MERDIGWDLASALSLLRSSATETYLWIDFLCINQNDIEEKVSQVGIMSEIFSGARRVCVLLGQSGSETAFGFQAFEQLKTSPVTAWKRIWDHSPDLVRAGILDFMGSPWWTRIWCVQEAVMAKEVRIMCGEHSMSWSMDSEDIFRFSRSLKVAVLSPQWKQHDVGIALLNPLMELLRLQLESGPGKATWEAAEWAPDLLDVAYDMHHRLSTDPRDRIFSLFAFTKGGGNGTRGIEFEPWMSYSDTHEKMYENFVQRTLPEHPFRREITSPDGAGDCTLSRVRGGDSPPGAAHERANAPLTLAQVYSEAMKGLDAAWEGRFDSAARLFAHLGQSLLDVGAPGGQNRLSEDAVDC
jgi:hypothetical protein